MQKLLPIGLCAICALACTREMSVPISVPAIPAGTETVEDVRTQEGDARAFMPGVALVYVDDATAVSLEEGARLGVPGLKVTSARRLFPDAGEWEPRTRASGLHRWYVVEYDRTVSYATAKTALEVLPFVETVEPNYVIKTNATVNDPYWNQMWGMNNTAYPGYDVNCQPVWEHYTMGDPSVVVAVVDGGIQLNHPDLKDNVAATGHYNYVYNNTTINQDFHGTHVAGTIAAVNNNGTGVTGIAGGNAAAGKKGVKLLSLQVFDADANGRSVAASDFNRALKEAADRGAIISQNSWGYNFDFNEDGQVTGYELNYARSAHENPERSFTQAVDYFNTYAGCDNDGKQLPGSPMKGGVVFFAAGNEDIPYGSPGNYDGCISVGAMDRNGSRAYFSNYGDWVDICAPGVNIPSTYINNGYTSMSGTSMACPHVSGVAALVVSACGGQGFTADELRARLIGGARSIGASAGNKPIGPLVDAMGAVQMNSTGETAPDPVTEFTVTPQGHNLRVDFTAVEAYGYLVMAAPSRAAIENADYNNPAADIVTATKLTVSGEEAAGTQQSVLLQGLTPDKDYYTAIVAYSYNRQYSPLSEIVRQRTNVNLPPTIVVQDYPEGGFVVEHYQTIRVPVRCSDPDGDAVKVTYSTNGRATMPSNNGSQELYIFTLMGPLAAPGSYSAVIKATDELGAGTTRSILYTVKENTPPTLAKEPQAVQIDAIGATVTIDLDNYFTDPDGESLEYRASSMDTSIATETLDGRELTVTGVALGLTQIRVSAFDHTGAEAGTVIAVLVRPEGTPEVYLSGDSVVTGGTLTFVPPVEDTLLTLRIIDMAGVVVYQTSGTYSAIHPLEVNTDGLAPGMYVFEITCKGNTYTYTIVKR